MGLIFTYVVVWGIIGLLGIFAIMVGDYIQTKAWEYEKEYRLKEMMSRKTPPWDQEKWLNELKSKSDH